MLGRPDVRTSERQKARTLGRPDARASGRLGVRTPGLPGARMLAFFRFSIFAPTMTGTLPAAAPDSEQAAAPGPSRSGRKNCEKKYERKLLYEIGRASYSKLGGK